MHCTQKGYRECRHEDVPHATGISRQKGNIVKRKIHCDVLILNVSKVEVRHLDVEGRDDSVIRFGHDYKHLCKDLCLEDVFDAGGMNHKILWTMKKMEMESEHPVLDALSCKRVAKLNVCESEHVMVDPQCADDLATACKRVKIVLVCLPLLQGLIKSRCWDDLDFKVKSIPSPVILIRHNDCDEQNYVFCHQKIKEDSCWTHLRCAFF